MSVLEKAREQLLSHGSWSVDPAHSTIEFRVKHMVVQTVKGRFRDFDGAIVAGAEPAISAQFASQAWRRSTRNVMRTSAPRTSSMSSATPRSPSRRAARSSTETTSVLASRELTIKA